MHTNLSTESEMCSSFCPNTLSHLLHPVLVDKLGEEFSGNDGNGHRWHSACPHTNPADTGHVRLRESVQTG